MGLVAVKLLDLHAELVRLRWPIGVPVLHARAHCGTRDPNEGDAAEAVPSHLTAHHEAEAAAEALDVESARLSLSACTHASPMARCHLICHKPDELVYVAAGLAVVTKDQPAAATQGM